MNAANNTGTKNVNAVLAQDINGQLDRFPAVGVADGVMPQSRKANQSLE